MKTLVYYGYHDMRLEERPIPVPKDNEVLVKVRVASVCGTDIGIYQLKEPTVRFAPPLVLGHEFTGEIAGFGKNAGKYSIGTRVAANPMMYCGECFYCKRGDINLCANRTSLGTSIGGKRTDGSMQEYFAIREDLIIPLDDRVSDEEGSILEPLAVCYHAALAGSFGKGERVVVTGAGPIGLFIVKFLKMMGATCIIVSDIVDSKLEYAKKCGADEVVNVKNSNLEKISKDLTGGIGADRVIITAGNETAIPESFKFIRNGGHIVVVAITYCDVKIDPVQLVTRNISMIGSYMFRGEHQIDVMNMLAEGKLKVSDIITSTCPLSDGVDLFKRLSEPDCKEVKVLITA